ncbi:hypothetical protein RRG08_026237 [Elysia crispata]|uniref:Uncharacterized protein n=1 Tax=Elysia crispata TaxID=231223 RepID=A0AAE1DCS7_9GAST|nr:hypothetical protein RRG08_026237 [Elysia crispata]
MIIPDQPTSGINTYTIPLLHNKRDWIVTEAIDRKLPSMSNMIGPFTSLRRQKTVIADYEAGAPENPFQNTFSWCARLAEEECSGAAISKLSAEGLSGRPLQSWEGRILFICVTATYFSPCS